ncbi:MAG: NAD(P)-dependent oxidoreductase [Verrucomicrobia bacterium]|nr:NAD(P)-dependent oxidoreductase [Verrucomicrobiota bacterium]
MAKALVIGGLGFVGTEVVRQARRQGDAVTVLDIVAPPADVGDYVQADFTNAEALNKALEGRRFDVMYHVASLPGDTGNPRQMMQVNVWGLLNLLEWARANPVTRYVLTSSISALEWYPATPFNPPDTMPVDEEHRARPKDMYSTSKRMQELLVLTYYHEYKVPVAVLRLTAVVGPGGKGGGRGWRQFAEMLAKGEKVQIPHFSPEELCHYVDLRDVARLQLTAAKHPKAVGEIFNCCAAEPTRGSEFIEIVKRLVPGIEVECGFAWSMAQGGEISFSMAKAKRLLGFEPKYSLADAVASIKQWVDQGGLEADKVNDLRYGQGVQQE